MIASTFLLVVMTIVARQTAGQSAARSPPCAGDADVAFVVDASSSTTASDFATSLNYLRGDNGFLRLMQLSTTEYAYSQVGLVTNKDNGVVEIGMGNISDFTQLVNAIQNVGQQAYVNRPGNLTAALRLAANQFFTANGGRTGSPHILVMIVTDVLIARTSQTELNRVTNAILGEGVTIIAVVYGSSQDPTLINSIVSGIVSYPPNQYKFYFLDSRLNSSTDNPNERNISMNQLCVEIPICATIADIAFLLDTSGNVWPSDWASMILFVQTAVQGLNIGPNGTHVALMKFDASQNLIFNLRRYSNRYDMLLAIENVQYDEGHSIDTAQAILFASNNIFSSTGGWRAGVVHIMILITTGYSNIDSDLTKPYAQQVHDRGIFLFAIGVGLPDPTLVAEMRNLASQPPEQFYYQVSTFESLQLINTALVNRACVPKPAECNATLDVAFLIDTSGSIPSISFQSVQALIVGLSARLKIQQGLARVSVTTFSDMPYPQFYLNTYTSQSDLAAAVTAIPYSGGKTNTAEAIKFVRQMIFNATNGARPGVTEVMILVTDGEADNKTAAANEAKLTRDAGISIIAIGIGPDVDSADLQTMATYPSDRNTILVDNYDILSTITETLVNLMCAGVDNCLSNPCKNNGVCESGLNSFFCSCKGGFTGRLCDQNCSHYADVVFVLDSSGSISSDQYMSAQNFIRDIILGLNVDGGSRVGALIFSTDVEVVFNLNAYNTTQQTLNAINFRYQGGSTNMADALRVTCQNMFTPENGDRNGAVNVLILLTDGKSNDPDSTLLQALDCRARGIHISALGIGQDIDVDELTRVVAEPSSMNFIQVVDFNSLTLFETQLLNSLCNTVNECTSNPCYNTSSCIDGINQYTCICPIGQMGTNCDLTCSNYADVAFVVDYSASYRWEVKPNITNFIRYAVSQVDVARDVMRVSLMYYTDQAKILANLSRNTSLTDLLYQAYTGSVPINFASPFFGKSNMTAAFVSLRNNIFNNAGGDRANASNIAVFVLDAVPTIDYAQAISQAILTHMAGVYTILVTVGEGMNSGRQFIQLQTFSSDPVETNFLNVWNFTSLPRLALDVAARMCNSKNECLSNPCVNGGTCVDGISQYLCKCSSAYSGSNCARSCAANQLDVVFIVDVSGSLEGEGYFIHKEITKTIVNELNFNFDRTHVALVTFATQPVLEFSLNTYVGSTAQADIKNAIVIDNVYDGTNIAAALDFVAGTVLTAANGRRSGAEGICILLSDGRATLSPERTVQSANTLQSSCTVFAISVDPDPQQDVMDQIASPPSDEHTAAVPTRFNITDAVDKVVTSICNM